MINDTDCDYKIPTHQCIHDCILVHFSEDGSIAFDGEILSAIRRCSEYGYLDDIAERITEFLYSKDYDRAGFGVWTLDA